MANTRVTIKTQSRQKTVKKTRQYCPMTKNSNYPGSEAGAKNFTPTGRWETTKIHSSRTKAVQMYQNKPCYH